MAAQIVPIQDIASTGLMRDYPDVSLPPNAFSDVLNMRFHNNAIRKIEGDTEIHSADTDIVHVAFWANPNLAPSNGYYIYIVQNGDSDEVWIRSVTTDNSRMLYTVASGGRWQHTLFGGSYAIVLNNGQSIPRYILDTSGNTNISSLEAHELPGWDQDYYVNDLVTDITYSATSQDRDFSMGKTVDFTNFSILVSIYDTDGEVDTEATLTGTGGFGSFSISNQAGNGTTQVTVNANALPDGYRIVFEIRSNSKVELRANVVRTFQDLLVAGDITEYVGQMVVRRLPGVVRTSDVAAPGSIPTNWNPFNAGVNTADELALSSTGVIQDMVELQGRLMIYTHNSIHSLTPTNNPTTPFRLDVVTTAYGAHSIDSVLEVDGKHIVVGSNDIYIFPGHPANIQSVGHGRVRHYFYDNINPDTASELYWLRNTRWDEVWLCYQKTDDAWEALIWNYRTNLWTRRVIGDLTSGTSGLVRVNGVVDPNQQYPVFANGSKLAAADISYSDVDGTPYDSFFERQRLEVQPILNTESLSALGLWAQSDTDVVLTIELGSSGNAGEAVNYSKTFSFNTRENYKSDVRFNSRFISFKISDSSATDSWNVSGMQVEYMIGGRR